MREALDLIEVSALGLPVGTTPRTTSLLSAPGFLGLGLGLDPGPLADSPVRSSTRRLSDTGQASGLILSHL